MNSEFPPPNETHEVGKAHPEDPLPDDDPEDNELGFIIEAIWFELEAVSPLEAAFEASACNSAWYGTPMLEATAEADELGDPLDPDPRPCS